MIFQRPSKSNLLLILVVFILTLIFSTVLFMWLNEVTDLKVPSIGTVRTMGIEAYWNESLDNKTEVINWDIMWLGSSKNVTLYLRSISNVITLLQLNATNWNPINMSEYLNLSWNYNGTPIKPGEVIRITITLSAPPSVHFIEYITTNDVEEYSLDIVISVKE